MTLSRAVATASLLLAATLALAACGEDADVPAADGSPEVGAPSDTRFVVVDVCLDGRALRLVVNGRPGSYDGPLRTPFRTVVTRTDTGWLVTESRGLEGTC